MRLGRLSKIFFQSRLFQNIPPATSSRTQAKVEKQAEKIENKLCQEGVSSQQRITQRTTQGALLTGGAAMKGLFGSLSLPTIFSSSKATSLSLSMANPISVSATTKGFFSAQSFALGLIPSPAFFLGGAAGYWAWKKLSQSPDPTKPSTGDMARFLLGSQGQCQAKNWITNSEAFHKRSYWRAGVAFLVFMTVWKLCQRKTENAVPIDEKALEKLLDFVSNCSGETLDQEKVYFISRDQTRYLNMDEDNQTNELTKYTLELFTGSELRSMAGKESIKNNKTLARYKEEIQNLNKMKAEAVGRIENWQVSAKKTLLFFKLATAFFSYRKEYAESFSRNSVSIKDGWLDIDKCDQPERIKVFFSYKADDKDVKHQISKISIDWPDLKESGNENPETFIAIRSQVIRFLESQFSREAYPAKKIKIGSYGPYACLRVSKGEYHLFSLKGS